MSLSRCIRHLKATRRTRVAASSHQVSSWAIDTGCSWKMMVIVTWTDIHLTFHNISNVTTDYSQLSRCTFADHLTNKLSKADISANNVSTEIIVRVWNDHFLIHLYTFLYISLHLYYLSHMYLSLIILYTWLLSLMIHLNENAFIQCIYLGWLIRDGGGHLEWTV